MSAFSLVITNVAINELAQSGTEARLKIAEVGISSTALAPDPSRTSIPGERLRVPISGGRVKGGNTLHAAALIEKGTPEFWIKTIAYYSDTGTLIGYFSVTTGAIAWRGENADVLAAYDIGFQALPADSIEFIEGTPEFDLLFTGEFATHGAYMMNLNHELNILRDRVKQLEN